MTPEQEPHRHAPNAGPLQAIAAANWLPWPRKPLGKSKTAGKAAPRTARPTGRTSKKKGG